jgi:hypothetical protein
MAASTVYLLRLTGYHEPINKGPLFGSDEGKNSSKEYPGIFRL